MQITGILFGLLIQHQLVEGNDLGTALRFVLEALGHISEENPMDHKMFSFGLTALSQFKNRCPEWPPFCSALLQIPHFAKRAPVELVEYLRAIVNKRQVEGKFIIFCVANCARID